MNFFNREIFIFSCLQHLLCVDVNVTERLNLPTDLPLNLPTDLPLTLPSVNFPLIPNIRVDALLSCDQFVGYLAVYRVCMAVASFFFLLSIIMLCVWSSKDPRSYLQNGFWFFKWLIVIGLIVAFFYIPEGSNFYFSRSKVIYSLCMVLVNLLHFV